MTIPFGKMFPYLNPQVSLQIVENPASLPRWLPISLNRFGLTIERPPCITCLSLLSFYGMQFPKPTNQPSTPVFIQ